MISIKRNRNALGALGAVLLLLILAVVGVLGANAAMPYTGKQTIAVGDTLTYELTFTGDVNLKGSYEIEVTDMTDSTLTYSLTVRIYNDTVSNNQTFTDVVTYSYDGNVLMVDIVDLFPLFATPEMLEEFESSYTVGLYGFIPVVEKQYSASVTGNNVTLQKKVGTNLILSMTTEQTTLFSGDVFMTMKLTDTSLMWVKLF